MTEASEAEQSYSGVAPGLSIDGDEDRGAPYHLQSLELPPVPAFPPIFTMNDEVNKESGDMPVGRGTTLDTDCLLTTHASIMMRMQGMEAWEQLQVLNDFLGEGQITMQQHARLAQHMGIL